MNPEQLSQTTMDPASRTLERVRVDDAALAERVFTDLPSLFPGVPGT